MTGPRSRNPGWQELSPADLLVVAAIGGLGAATVPVWVAAHLAGFARTGAWPALTLTDALHGLIGWPRHATDPRAGFPPAVRSALPGPTGMYLAVLAVLAVLGVAAVAVGRLLGRHRHRARPGFATRTDLRRALTPSAPGRGRRGSPRRPGRHRVPSAPGRAPAPGLFLGRDTRTRRPLVGSAEDSYLYLGPPRSGKGVHLIIGQTIDAPGPALVTATRPDTLRHTLPLREKRGPVAVFDPQQLAPDVPRLRWAPQRGCADPLLAISRARALAAGAQLTAGGVSDALFWQQMTEAVLRCYLHAADLAGQTMAEVLGWVARPADPTPIRILRGHPDAAPGWAEELAAQAAADVRQRDGVWAAVRRAVDALADPRVLHTCSPSASDAFDPAAFLADGGTLYLLGSSGAQLTVAPLITALVEDLVDTARRLAAASPDGRLDPPLTLLLDEAANIAPIPSLPHLLADGGGSGITTVCVLQSLAQARARWGPAGADAMWDSATTKVVLGGLAQADDLARISRLAGDIDDPVATRSHGPGGPTTSVGPRRLPALPIEAIRCLPPGRAIVLARRTPPVDATLTPWWDGPHASAIADALATRTTAAPPRAGR